ncbi:MAG TPA: hypothetical protein VED86_02240 [archaeon]|nr:hypothetical protein [archaeon]
MVLISQTSALDHSHAPGEGTRAYGIILTGMGERAHLLRNAVQKIASFVDERVSKPIVYPSNPALPFPDDINRTLSLMSQP